MKKKMTMMNSLGDRMKAYEKDWRVKNTLDPSKYYILRFDGRGFSKYTKQFEKPYDQRLINFMNSAGEAVSKELNSLLTYIQSDEISVFWHKPSDKTIDQMYFGGKVDKILTVPTSIVTNAFNKAHIDDLMHSSMLEQEDIKYFINPLTTYKFAQFDCRLIELPSLDEVINYFIWRQKDWVRNSIFMLGYSLYSNKTLHGLKSNELKDKIKQEKNIDWDLYPQAIRSGRMVVKTYYDKYIESINETVRRSQYKASGAIKFLHTSEEEKHKIYQYFESL